MRKIFFQIKRSSQKVRTLKTKLWSILIVFRSVKGENLQKIFFGEHHNLPMKSIQKSSVNQLLHKKFHIANFRVVDTQRFQQT